MLVGGADSFSRITYSGFARLGAIASDTCRPFDRERQGMVPGEGGAVLVLEPLMAARARGARVYAEVLGYGLTCDAHHMTGSHPEGHGAARAMRQALDDAGLEPGAVDYISAHGTGTPTNDRMETLAAKAVFGDRARSVPMSSVKSMIGHTMGAASAIEAAVCSLAIHTGRVPPTIGLREPDPECDLDYVAGEARELPVAVAMNNAYAFGGNNSSVLFGRVEAGDGARS
jgi:3-oxoacyl-[acyl-carrier-protein] synthase II